MRIEMGRGVIRLRRFAGMFCRLEIMRFGFAVFGVRRVLRSRLCFAALPLGFGMRGEGLRFEGLIKLVILVGNRLCSMDGFGR